jgi:hypothetical protein
MPCSSAVEVGQDFVGQPVSGAAWLSAAPVPAMYPEESQNAVKSAVVAVFLTRMLAAPD